MGNSGTQWEAFDISINGPKSALVHTLKVTRYKRQGVRGVKMTSNTIFNANVKWYALLFVRLAFGLCFFSLLLGAGKSLTWEVWYVKDPFKR